jgi:predicted tellurium resistance membrane protein TerC
VAELFTISSIAALVTLAALEIVLGIDNIVFIAIVTGRLPQAQRPKAQQLGLALAAIGRIALLTAIAWLVTLDQTTILDIADYTLTVKDLILLLGGLFLLAKATWEIHEGLEEHHAGPKVKGKKSFGSAIFQILMLDLVFSIDSVLTAVGMVRPEDYKAAHLPGTGIPWTALFIMAAAVVLAIAVMLLFTRVVSRFIEQHPTLKMLALSFMLLIGVVLVAEGFHQHIPRGYIYFSMGFSLFVEVLNLRLRGKRAAAAD